MRGFFALLAIGSVVCLTGGAIAETAVAIPEEYLISRSPLPLGRAAAPSGAGSTAIERPAAVDGYFWAEIFPVYNEGSTGNTSFFRLGAGTTASTFQVLVLGTPSGNTYGQGPLQVPANASPQKTLSDLLTVAGAGALTGGDTGYSIYLSNPATDSFYQHVIFNGTNLFFEDMTLCPSGASQQGGRDLTNVHSTIMTGFGFPGTVYIHNLYEAAATYTVRVRDSTTGTLLGTVPSLSVPANSTYAAPVSFFQTQAGVTPTSTQLHLTLEFRATAAFAAVLGVNPDPTDIAAILGAAVLNTQYNAVLNLSNKCSVNR